MITLADVHEVETFEACYARLWPSAVRLAALVAGSHHVAEEVAQDVFIGLRGAWPSVERPDAYVRTTIVRRSQDAARRARREPPIDPPELPAPLTPEVDELWNVLQRLPARQRAALVLRFYEDLPDAEVARLLECRLGTAKSLVRRGLARTKELLRG